LGGDIVAVGGVMMPISLGTSDFLVHHIHAFTIHVTVLILLKGVLFARSSRLIPDKANLGFRFPCALAVVVLSNFSLGPYFLGLSGCTTLYQSLFSTSVGKWHSVMTLVFLTSQVVTSLKVLTQLMVGYVISFGHKVAVIQSWFSIICVWFNFLRRTLCLGVLFNVLIQWSWLLARIN
jgi:hypothetical protein